MAVHLAIRFTIAYLAPLRERGATAVEYGLLIAGVAALLAAVVYAIGGEVQHMFSDTCSDIAGHMSSASASC